MIGTIEQKSRTACNGTKSSNRELLFMDGVVVEYIICFEQQRIGYEIVVYGIIAYLYLRVFDYCIEVYGLLIGCAWIYFCHHFVLNI